MYFALIYKLVEGGEWMATPFFGFKIMKFNIFGGFQRDEFCLGYEEIVNIYGGVITLLN